MGDQDFVVIVGGECLCKELSSFVAEAAGLVVVAEMLLVEAVRGDDNLQLGGAEAARPLGGVVDELLC